MKTNSASILVGNTPLVELTHIEQKYNLAGHLFAKVESFNPAGSVKDRVALAMILAAEKEGKLMQGATIIEPTSGNTGIGLASIGAMKGYKVILTMPSNMSIERQKLLKGYGAEIVLSDASLGMRGAIAKAEELRKQTPGAIILSQFTNPNNPKIHFETTGPEIYKDLNGNVDAFVAGVGTGGTITGCGQYLKSQNNECYVVAIEPEGSPVLSKGKSGPHKIQGIGAGFIPEILDIKVYDEVIDVKDEDAFKYAKEVGKLEGFLVGISSGAALKGAIEIASREEFRNKNIVVLFPDGGDRYLSTPLFED